MTVPESVLEDRDHLLALSRRLDWRFVFADPNLKHVVVAGAPDDELLNALAEFSDRVSIWRGQPMEACDMLVMHNPSVSLCRRALEVLKPARFYVAFDRRGLAVRFQKILCSGYLFLASRRGSYGRIRSYWHWPTIAGANRIIPLSQPEAMSFVVSKGSNHLKTRLTISGLDLLRRVGLLALVINGFGLAGERRP